MHKSTFAPQFRPGPQVGASIIVTAPDFFGTSRKGVILQIRFTGKPARVQYLCQLGPRAHWLEENDFRQANS